MPTIIRGRYMYLNDNERSPKTIEIKLPFWILDYSFEASVNYKVKAPLGKWLKREANILHLYPPDCIFWETKRFPSKRHSAYILFKNGELCGLDKLIDPNYNYLMISDPKLQLSQYLVEIAEIGYKYQEDGFWQAQTLLFEIISILHQCKLKGETAYISLPKKDDELSLIEKIDRYLFDNLSLAVSREDIATKFNISVSTLAHVYKKQTGMSPMKKLMQFRLNLAENMLQQGEMLEAIAEATGFSSAFHLSTLFKKNIGISPRDYRKKFKNDKII